VLVYLTVFVALRRAEKKALPQQKVSRLRKVAIKRG